MGREREAHAEVFERLDRFQPFFRVLGQRGDRRRDQVGVGAVVRTADATPDLVQLRESELVGAVDNDGIQVLPGNYTITPGIAYFVNGEAIAAPSPVDIVLN